MKKIIAAFLLHLISGAICIAQLNSPGYLPDLWQPDGQVHAVEKVGNTIYVGGDFKFIGKNMGGAALVSPLTGAPSINFPRVYGEVLAAVQDGQGGWFIGGTFSKVGSVDRKYIAHITATNTVDLNWNPEVSIGNNPFGGVTSLSLKSGILYFGGLFSIVQGQNRNNIAAVDAITGNVTNWNPNLKGYVRNITINANLMYVVGRFDSVSNVQRKNFACFNILNGTVSPLVADLDDEGVVVKVHGDHLYLGGRFENIAGQTRKGLASLNLQSGQVTAFNVSNFPGRVIDFSFFKGKIFLFGESYANRFLIIDSTSGNIIQDTLPRPDNALTGLAVISGKLYLSGDFKKIGGINRSRLARIDLMTNSVDSWDPSCLGYAAFFSSDLTNIFLGGNICNVGRNGFERHKLAAIDAVTGQLLPWNPIVTLGRFGSDSGIRDIISHAGKLYVGGYFSRINNQAINGIAAFDLTSGNLLPSLISLTVSNQFLTPGVSTLSISGNQLCFGGSFQTVNSFNRNQVACFDLNSSQVTSFDAELSGGGIKKIILESNKLYVLGRFDSAKSQARLHFAAFDITLNNLLPLDINAETLYSPGNMIILGNNIYFGGYFSRLGGQPRGNLASFDLTTGSLRSWNPGADYYTWGLTGTNDSLFVGGWFWSIGGQVRRGLACVSTLTGQVLPWNSNGKGQTVEYINKLGATIFVGGYLNGSSFNNYCTLAAFSASETAATAGNHPVFLKSINVYPNPANEIITVDYELPFNSGFNLLSTEGRLVLTGRISSSSRNISLSSLAIGTYILIIDGYRPAIIVKK